MRALAGVVMAALLLSGCADRFRDLGREPAMTPVGSGLQASTDPLPTASFPPVSRSGPNSLWDDNRSNLFRDARAANVGDVVTVMISINDSATFGNTTDRSQENKISNTFGFGLGVPVYSASGNGSLTTESKSSSNGTGSIDRSEKIQLSVAGVVTRVLPNGNMVITGSQEVRVNYELRVLNIAGIVRPRDISRDNTITYDKIAEARISYGGRGRLSEVQQPPIGQQIYDAVKPY